ncbi:MAG: dihydrodipicolinate synthase family protein [Leptotrichia sp.]|jgi:N-acetylneuraminate lyase 2|nr:dihydrodipicolinate synthase family protein [Leptotrichia sp.]
MRVDLEKFKGIFMAMYSAYDDNGNVDKERVKKLARYYADKKVKGLYVGGSSGEGVLQSEEERKQVVEAVMEEVGKELTIIVHVGANSTPESVRLAQHAAEMGVDAVSSIPAVYYRLSPASVKAHWQAMIDSTDLPFIIYHIPQTTGFNLPISLFEEMAKQEKVIGIKCSSESTFELQQFKAVGGKDFLVFNGPDEQFVAGRAIGADAGIGGTYGVMPELFMKLNEYMNNQEIDKARELQNEVNEIIKGLLSVGSLYGACKYILHLRGVETGVPRLPMLPITDEAVKEKLQKLNKTIEDLIERVK